MCSENFTTVSSILDAQGHELLDETPVEIGIPMERSIPLHVKIRQQLLELMQESSVEEETFKDADDFDVGEEEIDPTPYEFEDDFDHIPVSEQLSAFNGGAGGTPPDMASTSVEETTDNGKTTSENT